MSGFNLVPYHNETLIFVWGAVRYGILEWTFKLTSV